jgi:phosphoenolpyruvate carboxylase
MTRPKPLWKADDQKTRLSELTAPSDDSAKDHSLRRDVRSLGALLGRVLVEQVGQELFDTVEDLRRLMIRPGTVRPPGLAANSWPGRRR